MSDLKSQVYPLACAYYAFKIAYYALEQCSRALPIVCSIYGPYGYKPLYSTNSTIFLLSS